MRRNKEEEDDEIDHPVLGQDWRELQFSNLNYSVCLKSSHDEDTLDVLEKKAIKIFNQIKEK